MITKILVKITIALTSILVYSAVILLPVTPEQSYQNKITARISEYKATQAESNIVPVETQIIKESIPLVKPVQIINKKTAVKQLAKATKPTNPVKQITADAPAPVIVPETAVETIPVVETVPVIETAPIVAPTVPVVVPPQEIVANEETIYQDESNSYIELNNDQQQYSYNEDREDRDEEND